MTNHKKYFVAIIPPEPFYSEIHQIKTLLKIEHHTSGALKSPPHMTLHMPFEWHENKEHRLIEKLSEFKFNKSIKIRFNNFSVFEPRVLFIDVSKEQDLLEFQSSIVFHIKSNLHLYNQVNDVRGFHPHLTVAFRDLKKTEFYAAWDKFKTRTFQGEFECQSFVLLKQNEDKIWKEHQEFHFK